MFEVGVAARFNARHSLVGDFGPASRPHAHDYRVELLVRGARLREDGTLFDIGLLSSSLDRCVAQLDGQSLNQLPQFAHRNSTAEVVASWLADAIGARLPVEGLDSLTVRVWESPDAWASCTRRLGAPAELI